MRWKDEYEGWLNRRLVQERRYAAKPPPWLALAFIFCVPLMVPLVLVVRHCLK